MLRSTCSCQPLCKACSVALAPALISKSMLSSTCSAVTLPHTLSHDRCHRACTSTMVMCLTLHLEPALEPEWLQCNVLHVWATLCSGCTSNNNKIWIYKQQQYHREPFYAQPLFDNNCSLTTNIIYLNLFLYYQQPPSQIFCNSHRFVFKPHVSAYNHNHATTVHTAAQHAL